ncbi:hypothetical protein QCA50_008180 [Cerrena zonata]|uniref:Uncharacterized protein n=1 Tax=Cerrena zonata TaxID=2478898 RepID=A0AAW0G880_9APHY
MYIPQRGYRHELGSISRQLGCILAGLPYLLVQVTNYAKKIISYPAGYLETEASSSSNCANLQQQSMFYPPLESTRSTHCPRDSSGNSGLSPDIIAAIVICLVLLLLIVVVGVLIRGRFICCQSYTPTRKPRYRFNPRALRWNAFSLQDGIEMTPQSGVRADELPRYTHHGDQTRMVRVVPPIPALVATSPIETRDPGLPPYDEGGQSTLVPHQEK